MSPSVVLAILDPPASSLVVLILRGDLHEAEHAVVDEVRLDSADHQIPPGL